MDQSYTTHHLQMGSPYERGKAFRDEEESFQALEMGTTPVFKGLPAVLFHKLHFQLDALEFLEMAITNSPVSSNVEGTVTAPTFSTASIARLDSPMPVNPTVTLYSLPVSTWPNFMLFSGSNLTWTNKTDTSTAIPRPWSYNKTRHRDPSRRTGHLASCTKSQLVAVILLQRAINTWKVPSVIKETV